MKQKLFTLLTLALFFCSGAWAENYTDTYTTYNNNAVKTISSVKYLSCGLLTMITFDNGNVARNSGGTQITKNTTGTFTVYSRIPGLTIASIEMTTTNDPNGDNYSATNGTLTYNKSTKKYSFTPTGTPTSTQISITAGSSATCLNPITITLTGNALNYEILSTFENGGLGFTSTAGASTDLSLSTTNTNKAKGNGTNLSFQNGGDITFTAAKKKIKYITICYDQYMATGFTDNVEGSYSIPNILWTAPSGGVSSVKLTQTNSSTATISKILVAFETVSVSTLSGRNYGTMVTPAGKKLDFAAVASDAKAYISTGLNGAKTKVMIQSIDVVPASTPIILYTTTQGATVNVPITTDAASDVSASKLVAGDGTTAWNGTAGYTYFYVASDEFHEATSGTLVSGKAYLKILTSDLSGHDLSFGFEEGESEGDVTGISEVSSKKELNGIIFNLAGQRVDANHKGIVIVNGKKFFNK